jgi:hypothetical protein
MSKDDKMSAWLLMIISASFGKPVSEREFLIDEESQLI